MAYLTDDQLKQLNMYSIYAETPERPLFTLASLCNPDKTEDCLRVIETVSQSPNQTVAASFFLRRYGMFFASQLKNLTQYDEMWQGPPESLQFGALTEYGKLTVSTFLTDTDFDMIEDDEREQAITGLIRQADGLIRAVRTVSSVSPLTLWENIFGYLLWDYHVAFSNPETAGRARHDFDVLLSDTAWSGVSKASRFAAYTGGCEPGDLLNTTVRKTCCFSKDVPGLMQCGFCPLKN